jgi:hypothetical protein
MGEDLGIGFGEKLAPLGLEAGLERLVVLDDAVVNDLPSSPAGRAAWG